MTKSIARSAELVRQADTYVSLTGVAAMLGKSTRTIRRWDDAGTDGNRPFPRSKKHGSQRAWRLKEIITFADAKHEAAKCELLASAVTDPSKLAPDKL